MDFSKYFKLGVEIVKLSKDAITKVAKDEEATLMAVIFFAIGGLAGALLTFNPVAMISGAIGAAIFSFVGVGIMHLLAKLFGGKAGFMEFYRASGIGSLASWAAFIPYVGGLIGLWNLVVGVVILKEAHKLSTVKAIIVVLIPVIIVAVLITFLAATFLSGIFGGNLGTLPTTPKF